MYNRRSVLSLVIPDCRKLNYQVLALVRNNPWSAGKNFPGRPERRRGPDELSWRENGLWCQIGYHWSLVLY